MELCPLSCHFLTPAQMRALKNIQVNTIVDLVNTSSETLCPLLNITDLEYYNVIRQALKYAQPKPMTLLHLATPKTLIPVSTGLPGFDKLLDGGLHSGDIFEIYGKTGTGKSQLCLHLASQICLNQSTSSVLYFDMKNDFDAKRLHTFCKQDTEILESVQVFRPPNLDGLIAFLDDMKHQIMAGINELYINCRLIVVDSVPMVIYPTIEEDPLSWRFLQERIIERLAWFANRLSATVVLVNHAVTERPGSNLSGNSRSSSGSSSSKPLVKGALGKYWFQKISTRIQVTKNINHFYAILEKSHRTSEWKTFRFALTKENLIERA